jgi:L,D-transpeptidase catalytic domain
MPKKRRRLKHGRRTRSSRTRKTTPKKRRSTKSTLKTLIARAKKLERLDAGKPVFQRSRTESVAGVARTLTDHSLQNDDFPQTYIQEISVSLNDPNHWLTLTWTGSKANFHETGPFKTAPGAGLKGFDCDDDATSRRSGSKCTPKGTYAVQGFAQRLNSDSRATFVTWFMQSRGIALHYFPIVPDYAASHGCVRIESVHVAQLIHDNSVVGKTQVVVSGTWVKPPKQWT